METSYNGFYCSICNYDYHQYFNTLKAEVVYSDRFCRSMVEKTLSPALYIHKHFIKLGRIIAKFITNCDSRGTYSVNVPMHEEII